MKFVNDKENQGPAGSSTGTLVISAGNSHLLGSQSATHVTSKAEVPRGNFTYETGMNTAHFAKGNFYTLGAGSANSGPSLSASGGAAQYMGSKNVGNNSFTSSSHFGGAGHTPNVINQEYYQFAGIDTSNNNLLLRSSVGEQTTSALIAIL